MLYSYLDYIKRKITIIFKIFLLIILFENDYIINLKISFGNNIKKHSKQKNFITNNNTNLYNNKNITSFAEFSKFQNMIPHLTHDLNDYPLEIRDIFNARQLYISDIRITPEYIKFIRPINQKEEQKYKHRYSENITIIDENLFKKRLDQYEYTEFGKLSLEEKLIDENKILYENNPIISIILPSFNKQNILLKSIRSIQNQNFKNIEIIIVNDCSNDNSSHVFNYLLETDPRIRIFHHMSNMGLFRSRLDGILYSRGKYIILFDTGDLYEDNYVLSDAYNIIEKYNLDSCKFLFRLIRSFNNLTGIIPFHVGTKAKIIYDSNNIKNFNDKAFRKWGNIWTRLVRSNIYIKGIFLLNELMLNVYKNLWDDIWYNEIINRVSYNFTIFERIGYIYYYDGKGEGTPKFQTIGQKSNLIKEYVGFLYFDYNFCKQSSCKKKVIEKLKNYNEENNKVKLINFKSHFDVLNNLLESLIKDPDIIYKDKEYCKKLLYESKSREKEVIKIKMLK